MRGVLPDEEDDVENGLEELREVGQGRLLLQADEPLLSVVFVRKRGV